jgi:hypothetical protein
MAQCRLRRYQTGSHIAAKLEEKIKVMPTCVHDGRGASRAGFALCSITVDWHGRGKRQDLIL